MNLKRLCVIAGALLLLAIPSWWPYSFYILLRWFIFFSAAIVAYNFYSLNFNPWALTFTGVAFLFNPLAPLYLNKSTWVVFDFISAILFFIGSDLTKFRK